MVEELRKLGLTCGINVPVEDLAFLSQMVMGYLAKRPDGRRYLFKLFKFGGFKTEKASYTKTYFKEGYLGIDEGKIPASKLEELHVYLYDNKTVVPYDMVETMDRPDQVGCDDCGVLVPAEYCSEVVNEWSNGREYMVTLCNHCRVNKEDPKTRGNSSKSICEDCKLTNCSNWKEHHKREFESDKPPVNENPFERRQLPPPHERYSSL